MALTSKPVNQHFDEDKTLSAMIYGLPGTGKTMLTASGQTHPLLADLAYVDADPDGLLTVAGQYEGMEKISYNELKDLLSLPQYLKKALPNVHTVVFDTLTAVKARRLSELAEKRGDVDKQQIQDWGTTENNINKIVSNLRGAGYSALFTAGVKDEYNKEGTRFIKRRPNLPPSLNTTMEHTVSFIWHTYLAEDGTYNLMYLKPTGGMPIDIKTRNLEFIEKLKRFDRKDQAGTIILGRVGQPLTDYPNLATIYSLLLEVMEK